MHGQLRPKWQDFPRLAAVFGGFLIIAGIIILGVAALALAGYLDIDILLDRKYLLTFSIILVAVGLFDTFSATIIARW